MISEFKKIQLTVSQVGYLNWKLNQHVFFNLIISNIKFAAFLPHRSRDVINMFYNVHYKNVGWQCFISSEQSKNWFNIIFSKYLT